MPSFIEVGKRVFVSAVAVGGREEGTYYEKKKSVESWKITRAEQVTLKK